MLFPQGPVAWATRQIPWGLNLKVRLDLRCSRTNRYPAGWTGEERLGARRLDGSGLLLRWR